MKLKRFDDEKLELTSDGMLVNDDKRINEMKESVRASLDTLDDTFGDHGECSSKAAKENLEDTLLFIEPFRGTL